MPILEMKVPSPGESISEVEIAQWLVADGDYVEKDQAVAEVDSDKATLELPAEQSGVITLKAGEGDVVKVGQVVCLIDTSAERPAGTSAQIVEEKKVDVKPVLVPEKSSAPSPDPVKKDASYAAGTPSPAASKMIAESGVSVNSVQGTGKDGRITKQDVIAAMSGGFSSADAQGWGGEHEINRVKKCRCCAVKLQND